MEIEIFIEARNKMVDTRGPFVASSVTIVVDAARENPERVVSELVIAATEAIRVATQG